MLIDQVMLQQQKALQPPSGIGVERWFSRIALGVTKPRPKDR